MRHSETFEAWCAAGVCLLVGNLFVSGCKARSAPTPPEAAAPSAKRGGDVVSPPTKEVPLAYVGQRVCAKCHAEPAKRWQGSHHDRAMEEPTPASVLGDFSGASFTHAGETVRFLRGEKGYQVRVQRAGAAPRTLEVRYTFGVEPLQQYLLDVGGGRLQALSVAWDTRAKDAGGQRWFHLHGEEKRLSPGDRLHWESPAYNWNSMCAECHSTGVARGYDPQRDAYATTFTEIDVSCEACHGQGSRHVAWAEATPQTRSGASANLGFAVTLKKPRERQWVLAAGANVAHLEHAASSDSELEACAPCHSRRSDLGPGRGEGYHDRYRQSLLEPQLYYPDGQIRDEVFEYSSFLQSKMAARGVVCSDCHEPHSLELRRPGNALCGGCHRPSHYDAPSHHFHAQGTAGAQCVNCHMPARTYMVVDPRRDHRIAVPRPAFEQKVGAPDVCTECHRDRNATWAEAEISKRRTNAPLPGSPLGDALWLGREGQPGAADALSTLVRSTSAAALVRASALEESAAFPSPELAVLLRGAARDPSPLVRRSAARVTSSLPATERLALLVPLLSDVARVVRIEAAGAMLNTPADGLSSSERSALAAALGEYKAAREFNADHAEALIDLAELARRAGSGTEAESLLRLAIRKEPGFTAAHTNLADLYRERGEEERALETLEAGLRVARERSVVEHALGLALIRGGQRKAGIQRLRAAYEAAPQEIRFGYVYAIALFDSGSQEQSLTVLRELRERRPGDVRVLSTLIEYLRRLGREDEANAYASGSERARAGAGE